MYIYIYTCTYIYIYVYIYTLILYVIASVFAVAVEKSVCDMCLPLRYLVGYICPSIPKSMPN